jgi:anti-sigma regulatory factor (Ser/Thr protein kinase)
LVLEELLTNIISYGYDDDEEHFIEIEFSFDHPNLTMKITNDAKEFNPLSLKDPNVNIALQNRKVGGLGVFLTKKLMDKIEYSRTNNTNILIISKKVNQ